LSELTVAIGMVAPFYNLALVIIAVFLFIKLFRTRGELTYITPWVLLFIAVIVFVIQEVITVMRSIGLISFPVQINGFFELVIISLFIYALLAQKRHVSKHYV